MATSNPSQSKRSLFRTIGLYIAGLAPLITGLVGIWGYASKGYFIAKSGEVVDKPIGLVVCALFIVGGLAMIGYAIRSHGHRQR